MKSGNASMIERVNAILGAFKQRDRHLGTLEIARRTGLPKASVSRICHQLSAVGILEEVNDQFELGIKLFELGQRATRAKDLRRLALRNMRDLQLATHGTVHLAVLEGFEVVYLEILRAEQSPTFVSEVGGRVRAHATAVGKALLAFSHPDVVNKFIAHGLSKVGPRTITDPDTLRQELARIHNARVSYEREESGSQICCAASPIFTADGKVAAAISVSGTIGRLDVRRVAPAVLTSALALTRDLSGRFPDSTAKIR